MMLYHRDVTNNISGWWFGTCFLFFHILGMSSSQLTKSIIFRGVGLNHQAVVIVHGDLMTCYGNIHGIVMGMVMSKKQTMDYDDYPLVN